jgi:branched-chain amino acid transport system substrate-binding protein
MHRTPRRGIALAALIATVAALGACSSKSSSSGTTANVPGVTANSILIGSHQPLTGPAAPGYSKISAASTAFFNYVNANGGVNGRKITYKPLDDGYNPNNTQTVVRQLVLQDKVFAIFNGLGTPTHTGVLDFLKTNSVPDLFVASGSKSWNQPSKYPGTFGWQPDYTVEGKILGSYIKGAFAGKKVCFLGQGDDFGTDELAGLKIALGDSGLTKTDTYQVTNPNVAPQLGGLKAAGCEVVALATVPGFTALSLGTAAKLSWHPQFVVSNVGSDYATVAGLLTKAGEPLLEGVISDGYLPLTSDEADPWIQLFLKVNKDYNNNAPFDGNVEYGMAAAYTFVQAVAKAGKDLTRAKLLAAIEAGGFTGPGLVPFAYSKDNHSGFTGARIAKITGGKATYITGAFTTDDATGAVAPYSGSEGTPPANGVPTG